VILALPGNFRVQEYTTRGKIPTFMLGMEDGYALREMIGHHGPAGSSLNAEHTATLQTYLYWNDIRQANTFTAQFWYAGGPERPTLQDIAIRALRSFGVPTYAAPERGAPPGDLSPLWRYVPAVTTTDFNMYFHSDGETPETVPWTGLEATTRAYAKIIDETNILELPDLQRPEEPARR